MGGDHVVVSYAFLHISELELQVFGAASSGDFHGVFSRANSVVQIMHHEQGAGYLFENLAHGTKAKLHAVHLW